MATLKPTATARLSASSVGENTKRTCAQKTLLSRLRALYVEGTTQRATKAVLYTKSYSRHAAKSFAHSPQLQNQLLLHLSPSTRTINFPLYPTVSIPLRPPSPPLYHTPVLSPTTSSWPTFPPYHTIGIPLRAPFPPPISYSLAVTHHQQPANIADQLSTFLHEFKTMFNQLIQQNSIILNMLSTVIQKITQ